MCDVSVGRLANTHVSRRTFGERGLYKVSFFFRRQNSRCEQLFHLLHGDFFAGLSVDCFHHRPIGSIAQLFGQRVAIHSPGTKGEGRHPSDPM